MTTKRSRRTAPPAPPTEETIDVGEIVRAADGAFGTSDSERARALADLAALRTARGHLLHRRRDELAETAPDSDEVKELDTALDSVAARVTSFEAQAALAAKPVVIANPGELVVHGIVVARNSGVAGVMLSLADENGPLKGATAATDKTGSFELRYKVGEKPVRGLVLHVQHERQQQTIDVDVEPGSARFIAVSLEE
jgi:hypothetical protein